MDILESAGEKLVWKVLRKLLIAKINARACGNFWRRGRGRGRALSGFRLPMRLPGLAHGSLERDYR
jgi:hypothetical protein